MKQYWGGWIILLAKVAQAAPLSDQQFQAGRDRLQNSQKQSEALLQSLGQRMGLPVLSGEARSSVHPTTQTAGALFRVHGDLQSLGLPSGKLLFGSLVNQLVVGGEGSPALVELDAGQGLASGLRVMGSARPSGTPGRVAIEVNRFLLRTGKAITVQAVALDSSGALGLPAQVVSSKAIAVAGAMASSFISGLAAGTQTQSVTTFGFNQVQPTGRNALLQGVAQSAADQSKRLVDEATAEKPVLIIDAGAPVTVLIQEEVRW